MYWTCKQKRNLSCKGRVITIYGNVVRENGHNHSPPRIVSEQNRSYLIYEQTMANFKRAVQNMKVETVDEPSVTEMSLDGTIKMIKR